MNFNKRKRVAENIGDFTGNFKYLAGKRSYPILQNRYPI